VDAGGETKEKQEEEDRKLAVKLQQQLNVEPSRYAWWFLTGNVYILVEARRMNPFVGSVRVRCWSAPGLTA
jgi:hypothetical protein